MYNPIYYHYCGKGKHEWEIYGVLVINTLRQDRSEMIFCCQHCKLVHVTDRFAVWPSSNEYTVFKDPYHLAQHVQLYPKWYTLIIWP